MLFHKDIFSIEDFKSRVKKNQGVEVGVGVGVNVGVGV